MSEFKAGDKVKATEAFVAGFSFSDTIREGLQSEGTIERSDRLYLEVRLDNGYNIGQQDGVWYMLQSELEAVEGHTP